MCTGRKHCRCSTAKVFRCGSCAARRASLLPLLTTEEVTRFISPPPTTVEGFERFIEWAEREREAGHYACFAVVPDGYDTAVGALPGRQLDQPFGTASGDSRSARRSGVRACSWRAPRPFWTSRLKSLGAPVSRPGCRAERHEAMALFGNRGSAGGHLEKIIPSRRQVSSIRRFGRSSRRIGIARRPFGDRRRASR